MGPFEALLLGIVQGLTEFLPISSSGHLVLVPAALCWEPPALVFDTTLHLGTLVAVLAVFWSDLGRLLVAWWQGLRHRRPLETADSRLAWWILLATIPAALAGFLLEDILTPYFENPPAVGGFLLLTSLLLVLAELLGRRRRDLADMTWLDGLLVGIAQAAAILPGISRSGATMATGMLGGLKREAAARFSFLLSIPIIAGTGLVQLAKVALQGNGNTPVSSLVIGFLAAAIMGYLAIRSLLAYLRRWPLYPFALYCAIVGTLALLWLK